MEFRKNVGKVERKFNKIFGIFYELFVEVLRMA